LSEASIGLSSSITRISVHASPKLGLPLEISASSVNLKRGEQGRTRFEVQEVECSERRSRTLGQQFDVDERRRVTRDREHLCADFVPRVLNRGVAAAGNENRRASCK
jgi:translation initiation factor 2 beta subunit (eIF-2beta)/eIF-5